MVFITALLKCYVLLSLHLSVVGIAPLIKNSPPVVVIALILVSPTIRSAVLKITVPSYVVPTMPSYLIRKPGIEDKNPRSAVIIRTVPAPVMVDVVPLSIVNYIVRTPDGYWKALSSQIKNFPHLLLLLIAATESDVRSSAFSCDNNVVCDGFKGTGLHELNVCLFSALACFITEYISVTRFNNLFI